jgi:alpha-L-fucosidase
MTMSPVRKYVVPLSLLFAFMRHLVTGAYVQQGQQAEDAVPSWDDLDQRPLPLWYDQAKFGVFIHWGVFSVPAYGSEWFGSYWRDKWGNPAYQDFVEKTERANFAYPDYAHRFTAEFYQPDTWADLFAKAGAQYVVLTSKHHEGYCNWNSTAIPTTWNWNALDIGPRRDLLGDLAVAVKNVTSPHTSKVLKFGLYHSLYEWFNPLYHVDKANNFTTQHFVDLKTGAELYDLVNRYEPELIWSDGEWEAPSSYWKAREFLHWYATSSPVADTAIWNDRWGQDTLCRHGGFLTCTDRYNPDSLQPKKWENALTIDKSSWGYNRNATWEDYMTVPELVHALVQVVAYNGNMLLNIGPASDGTIHPIFEDRLLGIGAWLKVNGEAIYETTPWRHCQNETASSVFYTRRPDRLYVHFTKWPSASLLSLERPAPTQDTTVEFLGLSSASSSWQPTLQWTGLRGTSGSSGMTIQLPSLTPDILPCEHSWVLVIRNLANLDDPPKSAVS